MDIMDLRVLITLLSFAAFAGIVFWAYTGNHKERFGEAADLPFADDEMQARTIKQISAAELNTSTVTDSNSSAATDSQSMNRDEVQNG